MRCSKKYKRCGFGVSCQAVELAQLSAAYVVQWDEK